MVYSVRFDESQHDAAAIYHAWYMAAASCLDTSIVGTFCIEHMINITVVCHVVIVLYYKSIGVW